MKKIVFITGGARSGKSNFALEEASGIQGKKAYIATAEALDEEMRKRIEEHKKKRGEEWDTYEEPLKINDVIRRIEDKYNVIVIDCMTLWLSNLMHSNPPSPPFNKEGLGGLSDVIENLITALRIKPRISNSYIVSNEVGMGIVPDNEMARGFRDMAGLLNQRIAEVSDEVYMVVSGLPVKIKG